MEPGIPVMQKKITVAVLGTPGRVQRPFMKSTAALLEELGGNSGNLLFQYAIHQLIPHRKISVGTDIPWDAELVNKHADVIVIPAANFLQENFDLTPFVNFLEQLKKPMLVLGLGAQAENATKTDLLFHPSITTMLEIFKTNCVGIGVRGQFTKAVLERHGIVESVVIGCPSNFINTSTDFGHQLRKKWNEPIQKITVCGDDPWSKSPSKASCERLLVQLVLERNATYVCQSVLPLIAALRRKAPHEETPPEEMEKFLADLRDALAPELSVDTFDSMMERSFRFYVNAEQWLEDCSRFDLSIGLRLHGNMAALQAGTPAIWITHDSRTLELCETMALPHLGIDEYLSAINLEDVRSRVRFDVENFVFKRHELRNRTEKLLAEALQ